MKETGREEREGVLISDVYSSNGRSSDHGSCNEEPHGSRGNDSSVL